MRRLSAAAAALCLAFGVFAGPRAAWAGYAALVVDARTGAVLHAVNADRRNYPASLTKMMTLYLVFEALDSGRLRPDRKLVVSRVAAGRSPSKLGLRRGQRISVRDVVRALVTKSANDAATVIAEALGGTERGFARAMTRKARALGMKRTVFRNASGLPNWQQFTTARDMTILARALLRDFPHHYGNFSLRSFRYRGRTYRSHNRLLGSYAGADGIKTGYTRASGFNLVASAKRGGRRLIGVVMGANSGRWRDRRMARLLDRGFAMAAKPSRRAKRVAQAGRPPAPKRKPERARPGGAWSIQVGAFEHPATARRAIAVAVRAVPALLRTRIAVEPGDDPRRRLYRARLAGLSEKAARRWCAALVRVDILCIAVPSDRAQGSR